VYIHLTWQLWRQSQITRLIIADTYAGGYHVSLANGSSLQACEAGIDHNSQSDDIVFEQTLDQYKKWESQVTTFACKIE
jgi:hypothetical protein